MPILPGKNADGSRGRTLSGDIARLQQKAAISNMITWAKSERKVSLGNETIFLLCIAENRPKQQELARSIDRIEHYYFGDANGHEEPDIREIAETWVRQSI